MNKKYLRFGIVFVLLMSPLSSIWAQESLDENLAEDSSMAISQPPEINYQAEITKLKEIVDTKKWTDVQREGMKLLDSAKGTSYQDQIEKLLHEARYQLLFVKEKTDTSDWHEVQSGDYLGKIAKKYNTTVALIKKANGLKNDTIRPGMKLKVEKVPFSIEISIKKNELWLKQGDNYVKKYPVSTGEKDPTPEGSFKISNKLENPTWYHDDQVIAPGDPKNGLGSRWLGFDLKGYGIHGTIEPGKIGQPASLGCVRMHNEDVEEVFDIVPVGTSVIVHK